jgi:hypothetical protein
MADPSKLAPPAPVDHADRTVDVPLTIGAYDTSEDYPAKQKTRADFRPQEFERVIGQHGKYVTWRKALLCPCENRDTGQPQVDCEDCDGSGYVYVDKHRIRAHMVSFDKTTKIYEKFGMWLEGNVQITVLPQYRLGFRDSIEMEDALMSFNELLRKGNRRGRRSKLPDGYDSARYRITTVTRLAYHSGDSFALLESGYHFEVSEEGWIKWLAPGNSAVSDGQTYSVLYDFHPVFQIISHPHATRDDVRGTKVPKDTAYSLPIQAGARLDYLIDINAAAVPPVTG